MWQSSLVTLVSPSLSSISKLKLKPTSSAPNLADYDLQVTATIIQQDEAETPPREDTKGRYLLCWDASSAKKWRAGNARGRELKWGAKLAENRHQGV